MRLIFYFKRQNIIGLWLSLTLHACVGAGQNQPTVPPPTKIILILNGLWQNLDTWHGSILRLSTAFAAEGIEVHIHKLIEEKTSELSITEQAKYAFSEIQKYYGGPNYEIILIAHSQGGLRAGKLLVLNQEAKHPLNIKGLITLATPWKGAPAAAITPAYISKLLYKKPVQMFLKLMKNHSNIQVEDLVQSAQSQLFDEQYDLTNQPGVQDMIPGSAFLRSIETSLRNNDTPILLIAGRYNSVNKLLPTTDDGQETYLKYLKKLPAIITNSIYAKLFAGSLQHDMVVPVDSQLFNGFFTMKHVKRRLIEGAIHDEMPGLVVPKDQIIYNQPEAHRLIVEFAKKHFSFHSLS